MSADVTQRLFNRFRSHFRSALSGYRYVRKRGKIDSIQSELPVDNSGKPLPWLPYPAIEFYDWTIEQYQSPTVLEFGAGSSTLWLEARADSVTSIEHDTEWAERIRTKTGPLVTVIQSTPESYASAPPNNTTYDFVVIDGISRQDCIKSATDYTSNKGIILLDDFSRFGSDHVLPLVKSGRTNLTLSGPTPIGVEPSTTSFWLPSNSIPTDHSNHDCPGRADGRCQA